jgi:RNA polymerase-binding transcription factor
VVSESAAGPTIRLRALRQATTRRLSALEDEIARLRADRGAESVDDEHDPEGVTLSTEWSRLAGLREDAARELADVDAAIARVEQGTYGICAGCGTAIPAGRLEARPIATRCIGCMARAGR